MRVRGGDEYLDFVYDLLDNKAYMHAGMKFKNLFSSEPYDSRTGDPNSDTPRYQFGIVNQFEDFCSLQQAKEEEVGLSRMTAGFAWKWETKKHKDAFDIVIEGIPKRGTRVKRIGLTPPTPSTRSMHPHGTGLRPQLRLRNSGARHLLRQRQRGRLR